MAKVTVCDICYKEGKKLTETIKFMSVRKHASLRVDYCDACKSKIPPKLDDYIKFVHELNGIKLSDAEVRNMIVLMVKNK